jgi:hypothetical protein
VWGSPKRKAPVTLRRPGLRYGLRGPWPPLRLSEYPVRLRSRAPSDGEGCPPAPYRCEVTARAAQQVQELSPGAIRPAPRSSSERAVPMPTRAAGAASADGPASRLAHSSASTSGSPVSWMGVRMGGIVLDRGFAPKWRPRRRGLTPGDAPTPSNARKSMRSAALHSFSDRAMGVTPPVSASNVQTMPCLRQNWNPNASSAKNRQSFARSPYSRLHVSWAFQLANAHRRAVGEDVEGRFERVEAVSPRENRVQLRAKRPACPPVLHPPAGGLVPPSSCLFQ